MRTCRIVVVATSLERPSMTVKLHRGEQCKHVIRRDYEQTDCRCRKAIERYRTPEYEFLDSSTWVPAKVAAEELGLSLDETLRQAKAGQLNVRPRASASPRIIIHVEGKPKEMTPLQAAKSLKTPLKKLQQRIDAGEFETHYKDEHLEIEITTRWDYERCLLWQSAGICSDFQERKGQAQRSLFAE